jgi:hypothetical protein
MLACLKVSQALSTHLTVATVAEALMEQPHFICQNVYLCTLNFLFSEATSCIQSRRRIYAELHTYMHFCFYRQGAWRKKHREHSYQEKKHAYKKKRHREHSCRNTCGLFARVSMRKYTHVASWEGGREGGRKEGREGGRAGGRAGGKGGRENLSMYNRTEQKCNKPPAGYEALLLEPYQSLTRALLEP